MDALQSPTDNPAYLHEEEYGGPSRIKRIVRGAKPTEEGDDAELEEDYIKVRLYFFNSDKQIKNKLFTEEWYLVAAEHLDDAYELKQTGIPFLEVSKLFCQSFYSGQPPACTILLHGVPATNSK